uniref:Uncharacterized protein n=1 Tax=Anguilla anguilla TaxID=7936 RepID=A0A0E9UFP0_ANGAN
MGRQASGSEETVGRHLH